MESFSHSIAVLPSVQCPWPGVTMVNGTVVAAGRGRAGKMLVLVTGDQSSDCDSNVYHLASNYGGDPISDWGQVRDSWTVNLFYISG